MLVKAVRIIAIASVCWTARRFDIGDVPRLRPKDAQKGRGIHRAGAFFNVVRLGEDGTLGGPEFLEREDDFLKFHIHSSKDSRAWDFY